MGENGALPGVLKAMAGLGGRTHAPVATVAAVVRPMGLQQRSEAGQGIGGVRQREEQGTHRRREGRLTCGPWLNFKFKTESKTIQTCFDPKTTLQGSKNLK
jgi:hypothetical protein